MANLCGQDDAILGSEEMATLIELLTKNEVGGALDAVGRELAVASLLATSDFELLDAFTQSSALARVSCNLWIELPFC